MLVMGAAGGRDGELCHLSDMRYLCVLQSLQLILSGQGLFRLEWIISTSQQILHWIDDKIWYKDRSWQSPTHPYSQLPNFNNRPFVIKNHHIKHVRLIKRLVPTKWTVKPDFRLPCFSFTIEGSTPYEPVLSRIRCFARKYRKVEALSYSKEKCR